MSSSIIDLIRLANQQISDIKPSEWAEKNRIMSGDTSKKGPFSFANSPYTREILDCLSPDHPARIVAWEKGAQIGGSVSVVENGIGWIIAENPANIIFLVGHDTLVKASVSKIDRLINDAGLRGVVGQSVQRSRNNKTGDTDQRKDFPGGYLKIGATNHKALRQESFKYGFIDDFEAMKSTSKESGATTALIEQRFASFDSTMKLFYISTPERKQGSNIHEVFTQGDQRRYHIPCPCCGELIALFWSIPCENNDQKMAGMTWETDKDGALIESSVGYTCQKCEGFFTDEHKSEWLLEDGYGGKAKWIPTAKPSQPGYYSYHLSALYAPTFMFGWRRYVQQYLKINPVGGNRDEKGWQTFKNLVLGEPYDPQGKSKSAMDIQRNIRNYEIGIIPEKLSIADKNGEIVLLTCAMDINGKEDDARLDYEIVAWSESGSSYSIDHGSVGTFIPKDPGTTDRKKWTYRRGQENSVWPVMSEILNRSYEVDTGRRMRIFMSGLDTGYMTEYAYPFVDGSNRTVIGLKGDKIDRYSPVWADKKSFKPSQERAGLYIVNGNVIKDILSGLMDLKYDKNVHDRLPDGYMSFPIPSGGKYLLENYFEHFAAEHKIFDEKQEKFVWKKKSPNHQNHIFDCRVYNMVVRDIIMHLIFQELKIKNGTWKEFCDIILGRKKG